MFLESRQITGNLMDTNSFTDWERVIITLDENEEICDFTVIDKAMAPWGNEPKIYTFFFSA